MISFRKDAPEPGVAEALEAALASLKALAGQKRPEPARGHARSVLVPLGQLLSRGSSDLLDVALERIRASTKEFHEAWLAAVADELELACTEYVTSVDERYLCMRDYDFDYTSRARERLEARLRACEALGYALPEDLRQRIADADTIYAPYLKRSLGGK